MKTTTGQDARVKGAILPVREVLEFTALNAATKLFEKLVLDESKERAWVVVDEDPNLELALLRVDGALTRSEQVAVDQARDGLQAVAKKYVVETFELGEDDVRSVTVADEATGLEYVIEGQAEAVKLSVLITFVDEDVRDDAVSRNDAIKPIYSNLLVINFDGVIVERAAPRPTPSACAEARYEYDWNRLSTARPSGRES